MRFWSLVVGLLLMGCVGVAQASGPAGLVFNQEDDCPLVSSWELFAAPVLGGNPTPASAVKVATIQNATPVVCGAGVNATVSVIGTGNTRFWLQAVATDGTRSNFSNAVDATIPLATPALIDVHF